MESCRGTVKWFMMAAKAVIEPGRSAPSPRSRRRLGWAFGTTVLACFLSGTDAGAAQQSVQDRVVTGEPSCETCEIRIVDRVALGSIDDEVSPSGSVRVVLGRNDGFYLISDNLPLPGVMSYAPSGEFRGILGREGEGPGEMGRSWRLGSTPDGSLYVYDVLQAAVHVFGAEGDWQRTVRPVVSPLHGPVPLGDSILAIVPGSVRPPEVPDREVVLYHSHTGEILGGVGPVGPFVSGQPTSVSAVADGGDGTIWLARGGAEVIERWTASSQEAGALRWEEGWVRYARPDGRTAVFLGAHLWQDTENGLLWVVSNSPDPSYVAPPPSGLEPGQPLPVGYMDPASLNARHSPIVSVVDPERGQVLAHRMMDRYVHSVLGDGRLVVVNESETGYQWAEVLTLQLSGRADTR